MEGYSCCVPGPSYDGAKLKELNTATRSVLKDYVKRCFDGKVPVSRAIVSFECRVIAVDHFDECENDILGNHKHMALTEYIRSFTRERLAFGFGITPEHYSVSVDYRGIEEVVFRAPLELDEGDMIRAHVFTGENSVVTFPVERGFCVHPKRLSDLEGVVRAYRIDVLGDRKFLIGSRHVERSYEDEQYMLGIGLKE